MNGFSYVYSMRTICFDSTQRNFARNDIDNRNDTQFFTKEMTQISTWISSCYSEVVGFSYFLKINWSNWHRMVSLVFTYFLASLFICLPICLSIYQRKQNKSPHTLLATWPKRFVSFYWIGFWKTGKKIHFKWTGVHIAFVRCS